MIQHRSYPIRSSMHLALRRAVGLERSEGRYEDERMERLGTLLLMFALTMPFCRESKEKKVDDYAATL